MCVAAVLKETREKYGMSQTELGRELGFSTSAISQMERKEADIPDDVVNRAVRKLKEWRIAIEKCQDCESNIFVAPYLDGANDNHAAVNIKGQEEFNEATEAINNINMSGLINKDSKDELTDQEEEELYEELTEVYDAMVACQFMLLRYAEKFNVDLEKIRLKNKEKLHQNGALKRKNTRSGQQVSVSY